MPHPAVHVRSASFNKELHAQQEDARTVSCSPQKAVIWSNPNKEENEDSEQKILFESPIERPRGAHNAAKQLFATNTESTLFGLPVPPPEGWDDELRIACWRGDVETVERMWRAELGGADAACETSGYVSCVNHRASFSTARPVSTT